MLRIVLYLDLVEREGHWVSVCVCVCVCARTRMCVRAALATMFKVKN